MAIPGAKRRPFFVRIGVLRTPSSRNVVVNIWLDQRDKIGQTHPLCGHEKCSATRPSLIAFDRRGRTWHGNRRVAARTPRDGDSASVRGGWRGMGTGATARQREDSQQEARRERTRNVPSTCQILRQGDAVIGIGHIGAETGLGAWAGRG